MRLRPFPAAMLLGALTVLSWSGAARAVVSAGDPAPPFTKDALGGGTTSLSDYPQKVIVLFLLGYS